MAEWLEGKSTAVKTSEVSRVRCFSFTVIQVVNKEGRLTTEVPVALRSVAGGRSGVLTEFAGVLLVSDIQLIGISVTHLNRTTDAR